MILVLDNYDSFTYNLVHYIGDCGEEVLVVRNDEITIEQINDLNPEKIVISPGPCTPKEAGISIDLIQSASVPILGVCLGHQAIGAAFGGKIIKAPEIFHGKLSKVKHNQENIFSGIDSPYSVVRYHSLIIDKKTLSNQLKITAETNDGVIMGIMHKEYNIHGVQFHPESIKTKLGMKILKNFVNY